jgi:hypothetical protein
MLLVGVMVVELFCDSVSHVGVMVVESCMIGGETHVGVSESSVVEGMTGVYVV